MYKSNLRKIGDDALSITRKKYGRGYQYFDENNQKITSKKLLKRLKNLVIPPMWSEVYICKWGDGHIQAIGRDLKGRKQYIYHDEWEKERQQAKFAKLKKFAKALPGFRKQTEEHLSQKSWPKKKLLALVVSILDETGIRIGNRQYKKRNGTFGLTTLRRKHLDINENEIVFEYKGKSNKIRHVEIDDPDLISMIKKCSELPGYEIFRYKEGYNSFTSLDSEDVNDYIHRFMGEEFSSKDFRTWVATRLAVEVYPQALAVKDESPRKKFGNIILRFIADELGNTPAICKDYYVHPIVMRKIEAQEVDLPFIEKLSEHNFLSSEEQYLLKII